MGLTSKEVKVNDDLLAHLFSWAKAGASRSSTGQRTCAKFRWEDLWKQKDASAKEIQPFEIT